MLLLFQILMLHYERCKTYYGSLGGWGTYGSANDEEKRLTMMLFTGLFDALADRVRCCIFVCLFFTIFFCVLLRNERNFKMCLGTWLPILGKLNIQDILKFTMFINHQEYDLACMCLIVMYPQIPQCLTTIGSALSHIMMIAFVGNPVFTFVHFCVFLFLLLRSMTLNCLTVLYHVWQP